MEPTNSSLTSDSSPSQAFSWTPLLITGIALYTILCSFLRYQRRDALQKQLGFNGQRPLSEMTNVEAQAITAFLAEMEFPKIYYTSVQFALFKTYGIPTISKLLTTTKELSTTDRASKRYADTEILIQEFTANPPQSERALKAIARMNYIHSGYQKAGKISNEDMLYTLSVFITEPVTWIERYEWRSLTDMEYEGFLSESQWKDGLEFYNDISSWAEQYEQKHMVPAASNKKLADELIPMLLFYVPQSAQVAAHNIVGYLMGDRLSKAMIYPAPTKTYARLAAAIFTTRRLILRYLCLPRPEFLRNRNCTDADPKTGRYHYKQYLTQPFYVKPGFMNRWGPEAWFVRAFGGNLPGDKGGLFVPEGYAFEEVGPPGMKGKGLEEMREAEERLRRERPLGCPFAFAK